RAAAAHPRRSRRGGPAARRSPRRVRDGAPRPVVQLGRLTARPSPPGPTLDHATGRTTDMTHDLELDVAVLGGGLAGNLVARQILREVPGLSVALFERDAGTSWKVGESSVEIASHYFTRRLGLTRYLYENQLPKNGLRF